MLDETIKLRFPDGSELNLPIIETEMDRPQIQPATEAPNEMIEMSSVIVNPRFPDGSETEMECSPGTPDLLAHPLVERHKEFLCSKQFTLPDFAALLPISPSDTKMEGVTFINTAGSNQVFVHPDFSPKGLTVDLRDKSGGVVILGPGPVRGRIAFASDGCLFSSSGFKSMGEPPHIDVVLNGPTCALFGKDVSSIGSQWIVQQKGRALIVGDDCMISWEVEVRNYDSHAIFDLGTRQIINSPSDIIVGAHCWIGQKVSIIKGVTIGTGSIIGLGSIVTKDIPARCGVAGVPARVVSENISWDRSWSPSQESMAQIAEFVSD